MPGEWRVASSLNTLLNQINAAYPNRSKAADGSIGDAAHAASVSDHNPDSRGVVRARDFTHDPAHGFDAHLMADRIVASRDPRIKYVISRGRIASATVNPWVWRKYTGENQHNHHAHVSVVADSRADNTKPWRITGSPASPLPNLSDGGGKLLTEDGILDAGTVKVLQIFLGVKPDGVWGPESKKAMQRWLKVTPDGVVGPVTNRALNVKVSRPDLGATWTRTTTRALEQYLNRGLRAGTFKI
jgi:hypothetical protein